MDNIKPIKGYEGEYEITSDGVVYACRKYVKLPNHPTQDGRWHARKRMATHSTKGYEYLWLYKNGKREQAFIHRLVAQHFCSGESDLLVVNHLDENTHNNHYSNLEWVTQLQNMQHHYNRIQQRS